MNKIWKTIIWTKYERTIIWTRVRTRTKYEKRFQYTRDTVYHIILFAIAFIGNSLIGYNAFGLRQNHFSWTRKNPFGIIFLVKTLQLYYLLIWLKVTRLKLCLKPESLKKVSKVIRCVTFISQTTDHLKNNNFIFTKTIWLISFEDQH